MHVSRCMVETRACQTMHGLMSSLHHADLAKPALSTLAPHTNMQGLTTPRMAGPTSEWLRPRYVRCCRLGSSFAMSPMIQNVK